MSPDTVCDPAKLPSSSIIDRIHRLPSWVLALLAVIYAISPIDGVPCIPFDDWLVLGWAAYTLLNRCVGQKPEAEKLIAQAVAPQQQSGETIRANCRTISNEGV